jgi:hypothetical protein
MNFSIKSISTIAFGKLKVGEYFSITTDKPTSIYQKLGDNQVIYAFSKEDCIGTRASGFMASTDVYPVEMVSAPTFKFK